MKVDRLDQLVRCWIFADYIGAPAFQNDLMDAILSLYAETYYEDYAFPLYDIPFICKNALSGVPSADSCRFNLPLLIRQNFEESGFLQTDSKRLGTRSRCSFYGWHRWCMSCTIPVLLLGKEISAPGMCTQMGNLMLLARTRLHGMAGARKSCRGILLWSMRGLSGRVDALEPQEQSSRRLWGLDFLGVQTQ